MRAVSIIIPIVREDKARICMRAIKENAGDSENYEIVSMVDHKRVGCPKMLAALTERAKYDLVMFLGDDTVPQAGFLAEAVKAMEGLPGGWGVVGLSTEDPRGWNDCAHFLADKRVLNWNERGEFYSTDYKHCFGENELRDIAVEFGRFVYAEESKILHDHPVNGKGDANDPELRRAYAPETWKHDENTYWKRKIARTKKRVGVRLGIGWPITDEKIHTSFVCSFNNVRKPDYDFFTPHSPGQIDAVRNDIIRQALYVGITHLWMTDTDQIYFDADTLEKLQAHNAPIASVPVSRRYPPFDPILLREEGKEQIKDVSFEEIREAVENGGTVSCDLTGMGSVLFDMDVFTNIDQPWFKCAEYGTVGPGEDMFFWRKAKKAGYSVLADFSINTEHLTLMGVGFNTYLLFRKLMEGGKADGMGKQTSL